MKECVNCKALLEDDELFCHECGTKQEIKEEKDNTEESIASEVKFCIHCGEKIEADSTFCPFCGKPQEKEEVKGDEPQANKPEKEKTQTEQSAKEESSKEEPKVEEPKAEEPKVEESQPEESKPDEEPTYEWEEEKKSKAWIWILLVLLIAGGAGWYFFTNGSQEESSESTVVEEKKSEPVQVDIEQEKEEMLAFVKEFYLHYLDIAYLKRNVTENVLKKLRRDYPYDCEDDEDDCLATWIFSAYPHGADMVLEEGPVITQINNGLYKVDFKYSYMSEGQKKYEDRSVRLYVAKSDGNYKITTYQYNDNSEAPRNDEARMISEIPEGNYNLSLADMHMILKVHDSVVEGEYYFKAGSSQSLSVRLHGKADNGLKLHLKQTSEVGENDLGYMDGTFDGKTFKGEYDKDGYRHNFEVYVGGE